MYLYVSLLSPKGYIPLHRSTLKTMLTVCSYFDRKMLFYVNQSEVIRDATDTSETGGQSLATSSS
jgi:hypothetical protein